jgi:integrase
MGEVIRRMQRGHFLGYYLRWYEAGRRRQMASKQSTLAEARRMLIDIEARVARGEASIPSPAAPALLVSELVERFVAEYSRPRIKDVDRYRLWAGVALRRALPFIGKQRADKVTPLDIVKLRDQLGQKRSGNTVKVTLNFLGTMFTWAVREGLVQANPVRGIERPRTEHAIDFLSREETERLLSAAEAGATNLKGRILYVALALALNTGMRKGELLGLRWIDLDLDTRRLTVARSYRSTPKSGKARHLRLPLVLVPILREWRQNCPQSPDGSVLPIGRLAAEGRVATDATMLGLPQLMERAGLRSVHHPWHLMRHSFGSHFIMSGGNLLTLQKILGHADIKITLAYAHLAPDFLDTEMDRVKLTSRLR